MKQDSKRLVILMADDDEDDCLLIREAFEETGFSGVLRVVEDGEQLMDYLHHRGNYTDASRFPCPDIILLDLNMPRMDGRQALKEIKADPALRRIPVVIFTTSSEERDIILGYESGASSFITKPASFEDWGNMVKAITLYWFVFSTLPPKK